MSKLWLICLLTCSVIVIWTYTMKLIKRGGSWNIQYDKEAADHLPSPYNNSHQQCTNQVFEVFYSMYKHFPEAGEWSKELGTYQPSVCQFSPVYVSECLKSHSQHTIMIIGDSQGRHYYRALIGKLGSEGHSCQVKEESPDSKPSEWAEGAQNISALNPMEKVLVMGCTTCQSTTAVCKDNTGYTLQIAYRSNWKLRTEYVAPLFQKHYSHLHGQYMLPDIVLYFLPLQHVKNAGPVEKTGRPQIENIINVVQNNTNTNMDVYFLGTPGEVENNKTGYWKNHLFEGVLASEKIFLLTRVLYEELKQYISDPQNRRYGHINMVNMSSTRSAWGTDGVHYQEIWYEHIISNIFSQHCNSF